MTSQLNTNNTQSGQPFQEWQWTQEPHGKVTAELTQCDERIRLQLEMAQIEVRLQVKIVDTQPNVVKVVSCRVHQEAPGNAMRGGVTLKRVAVLQALDLLFSCRPAIHTIELDNALLAWLPDAVLSGSSVRRCGFYQWPELWLPAGGKYPVAQQLVQSGEVRHPQRPPHPKGEFYRRYQPSLKKTLSFRVIDPVQDLDRFHKWMNMPGIAPIWELGKPKEELHQYLVDRQQDPHIFSTIGCFDDEPFGYFELYWAMEDRLGAYYDALPFDRGFHLLVGNRRFLGVEHFKAWILGLNHYLYLDDPRTQRVMGEPRADNKKLLRYVEKLPCYRHLGEFDFPHKRAALMESERNRFFHEEVLS